MIQELCYLGIGSPAYQQWRDYGTRLLGAALAADGPDGAVRLAVDDVNYRLAIHPAAADEVRYYGWAVANDTDLHAFAAQLREAGVEVHPGDPATAAEREVADFFWFADPWGNRHEVCWGKAATPASFATGRPMAGKFVTGDQGLGHVVIIVPDMAKAGAFYADTLGFRLSDRIVSDEFNLRFYHVNGRHHSLALAAVPGLTGLNHLMLEVAELDDLGKGVDLARRDPDTEILLSLGRHTNDLMTSIYISTPSAFQIEYGWGGRTVDDRSWTARTYGHPSIWGHERSAAYMERPPGIIRPADEGSTVQ